MDDETPSAEPPAAPLVLHDGTDDLASLRLHEVVRPCPVCAETCCFDPVGVVRHGISAGWATSLEIERLQDRIMSVLELDIGEFDGRRTLSSRRGVNPYVRPMRCSRCATELLAVVSFGEVQPSRYWLVLEGLIAAGIGGR